MKGALLHDRPVRDALAATYHRGDATVGRSPGTELAPDDGFEPGGMMPAYVIYQAEVLDAERYEEYKAQAGPNVAAAGGRYLVRGGEVEALEGDPPAGRTVVLEFPTMQTALDWYRSEEYTAVRQLREGVARVNLYIVTGID